ncbi:MAG: DUF2516 family protein [Actinomycetota bacterium]|nr:MAG: DUF2516 family protein [Actinomycetota bacterium]
MLFSATTTIVTWVLWAVFLVIKLWAFVDCVRRRDDAFPAAGRQTKALWLVLTGITALTGLLPQLTLGILGIAGVVIALVYLFEVRPKLIDVTQRRW